MSKDIWVFADVNNGKIVKITYELLGKAVELAQKQAVRLQQFY